MSLLTQRSVRGLLALGLLTGSALTACGSQPQNFTDLTAERAKAEHIEQLSHWIYPPAEAEEARRGFVERCVKAAGGRYREPVLDRSLESQVYTGRTSQELRESGYGQLPAVKGQQVADFDQKGLEAYLGSETAEHFQVTFMDYSSGQIAADGCMAQSYEYIYGTAEDGMRVALLAPQFAQAIEQELTADEDYRQLQQDWADCMGQAGSWQVESSDRAVYRAQLLDEEQAKDMLAADISCRENLDFDQRISQLKDSYYESVYQRLKQFSSEIEGIQARAGERVSADRADPQDTSPVTLPSPTAS